MEPEIGLLERTVKLIRKYGIWKVVQGILVMCTILYIVYNISNLDTVFRKVFNERTTEARYYHDKASEYRVKIKPEIDNILKSMLADYGADRAFIMEMHNGTNSAAGLPFIYAEMTYEEVRSGYHHVDGGYAQLNLSRFDIPVYLKENKMWYGTTEQLKVVDEKFAYRVFSDGVSYIAMIAINGYRTELGLLGVSYCDGHLPYDEKAMIKGLTSDVQRISLLLDTYNIDGTENQ